MSRGLILSLILLAVLVTSLGYLLKNDGNSSLIRELKEKAGISSQTRTPGKEIPSSSPLSRGGKVPSEFQSGKSRFSQGSCKQDSDCSVGGCSGEVCSGQKDVISTCEFSDSFPNAKKFQCGCIEGTSGDGVCGWR